MITIVSVTVATIVTTTQPDFHPSEESNIALFPSLVGEAKNVSRLIVHSSTGRFTIERHNTSWQLKEKDDYPIEPTRVREVIMAIARVTLLEQKTSKVEKHALLEVINPSFNSLNGKGNGHLFTLQDTNGLTLASLIIGKRSGSSGGDSRDLGIISWNASELVYVRRPHESQVWLARVSSPFPAVDVQWWVNPTVVAIDPSRITRVTLIRDDQILTVTQGKDRSIAVQPILADAKINELGARKILNVLSNLLLEDIKRKTEQNIALLSTKVVKVTFTTDDGLCIDVVMYDSNDSSKENLSWVAVSATVVTTGDSSIKSNNSETSKVKNEANMINERTSTWLYQIPSYAASTFRSSYEDVVVKVGEEGIRKNLDRKKID